MSVIAHYYFRQQSLNAQPVETKRVQTQPAAPTAGGAVSADKTTFTAALTSSQQAIAKTADAPIAPPRTASSPAPAAANTAAPTLEQLINLVRSQGWSDKQIALMKRLALRKNSRTGQSWSSQAAPAGHAALRKSGLQIRDTLPYATPGTGGSIRGIRNNNPGNLEAREAFTWLGQNGSDGRFATFSTPEHGIRALGVNLLSYHRRGLDTIGKIISRWAPPQDNNDTPAYIEKVSRALGVSPHARLEVNTPAVLSALSKAIIHQENGTIPFSEEVINSGVFSALGLQELPVGRLATKNSQAISSQSRFALQTRQMSAGDLKMLQHSLEQQVQAAKVVIAANGVATHIPSKAELVAAWGYTEGSRRGQEIAHLMASAEQKKKSRA